MGQDLTTTSTIEFGDCDGSNTQMWQRILTPNGINQYRNLATQSCLTGNMSLLGVTFYVQRICKDKCFSNSIICCYTVPDDNTKPLYLTVCLAQVSTIQHFASTIIADKYVPPLCVGACPTGKVGVFFVFATVICSFTLSYVSSA